MVTRTNLSLAAGLAILLLATGLTPATFAASYATSSPEGSAIQYVYFDPAAPPSPGISGWEGSGKYVLPPGIGAVTINTMAFGSIMTGTSETPSQAFVVRLTIANAGTQSIVIDPATVRLMDKAGRVLVGARAFSGNVRVTSDTIGPGGKDIVQLEFPLTEGADIRNLEIEDVDLPYSYGGTSYVTQLGFAPAETKQAIYLSQTIYSAPESYPIENTYYNYYSAPYNPLGYTTGYTSDLLWQPGWGWQWWPGTVGFFDNAFIFRHHERHDGDHDADDIGCRNGWWNHDMTLGAAALGAHARSTTRGLGSPKILGNNFGVSVGTGNVRGVEKGSKTTPNLSPWTVISPTTTTRSFTEPKGTGTPKNLDSAKTSGVPHVSTFSAPQTKTTSMPHVSTAIVPRASTFSAPHVTTFSAPRTSTFSAPHISTFSAPHISGGGEMHGGGGGHSGRR
jgi:hypothetical protein